MNIKMWKVRPFDKEKALDIVEQYSLPNIISILLSQRLDIELIDEFLNETEFSQSPFEFADMEKAVDRVIRAVDNFQRIAVFGDYDADGITSTAILYEYLGAIGADVISYIPERQTEGYGLNMEAVDKLKEFDVKLIITVDNGIVCFNEVAYAKSLGIDTIITDHHKVQSELPDAVAVVNPHREDCMSEFKGYCGAGVALQLALALELQLEEETEVMERFSDLATLGTIADVVPLMSENRTLLKNGLASISETSRLGLSALLNSSKSKKIDSTSLSYSIIPALNAAGRIGHALKAVNLLLTDDEEEAQALCEDILNDNAIRKKIEAEILEQAIEQIESNVALKYSRVLVVGGNDWHEGVIGIVASRLVERYSKPTIVLSIDKENAKGSGRSVEGFNLFDAVNSCKDLLSKFGGHTLACGLSLDSANIELFTSKLNEYAKINNDIMPFPVILLDLKLQPAALSVEIPEQLSYLEPFGKDNQIPLFGLYSMKLSGINAVGAEKNHLRLEFTKGDSRVNAMLFFCEKKNFVYKIGTILDLAVNLSVNQFNGNSALSIVIKALKPHSIDIDKQNNAYRLYEKYMRSENLKQEEYDIIAPSKEDFALLYRFFKYSDTSLYSLMQILCDLPQAKFNLGKLLISLDALIECELISVVKEDILSVEVLPATGKTDIMNCKVLDKLRNLAI